MHRAREIIYDTLATTLGVLLAGAFFFALFQGWKTLPRFVGAYFPSVEIGQPIPTSRENEKACFDVPAHKVRRGLPLRPEFRLETPTSPALGLSVYRVDDRGARLPDQYVEHHLGSRWVSHYCFDMPGTVTPADRLTVYGSLLHRRWFGVVVETVPTFTIAPVPQGTAPEPP